MAATSGDDERRTYRIGELADLAGVTSDAIRYYERRGLLPGPPRSAGGFRRYPVGAVASLRFIKRAQRLGFTLDEIGELVAFTERTSRRRCERVRALITSKLVVLAAHEDELQALRSVLERTRDACVAALDSGRYEECPVRIEAGGDE